MYADDELKNLSEEDKKKQRRTIQTEIIILESDKRKIINEKNRLEAEMRNLKMDGDRIRMSLEDKRRQFEKTSAQIIQFETEEKRLKRRLNMV